MNQQTQNTEEVSPVEAMIAKAIEAGIQDVRNALGQPNLKVEDGDAFYQRSVMVRGERLTWYAKIQFPDPHDWADWEEGDEAATCSFYILGTTSSDLVYMNVMESWNCFDGEGAAGAIQDVDYEVAEAKEEEEEEAF